MGDEVLRMHRGRWLSFSLQTLESQLGELEQQLITLEVRTLATLAGLVQPELDLTYE